MPGYLTAETIKGLREGRGLTQRALADAVGVTDKAVSKWESGRGLPDISLVEPLAAALGVSVAELLTGDIRQNANRAATSCGRGSMYAPYAAMSCTPSAKDRSRAAGCTSCHARRRSLTRRMGYR